MDMSVAWWLLLTAGVVLMALEIGFGGFIFVWFGLGAVLAAGITFLMPGLNLGIQLLLSVLLGAVLLYFFRDRFTSTGGDASRMHTFEANDGQLVLGSGSNARPQVFCNGTHWPIANPEALPEGAEGGEWVKVESFQNNRAVLRPRDE